MFRRIWNDSQDYYLVELFRLISPTLMSLRPLQTRGHICSIRLFSPSNSLEHIKVRWKGGETFRIIYWYKHRYRVFIFTFFLTWFYFGFIDKTWEKWLFLNFSGLYFNIHNIGNLYLNAWSPSQGSLSWTKFPKSISTNALATSCLLGLSRHSRSHFILASYPLHPIQQKIPVGSTPKVYVQPCLPLP